jgi:23S rRNA (cytosine1962-C5)-methyltransferase
LTLLTSADWDDYELLDSGNLKKLERFGSFHFIRPEPQAMWRPRLAAEIWAADGVFQPGKGDTEDTELGGWQLAKNVPESWRMQYQGLNFLARPTPFRHLGFFPEQANHWNWCAKNIQKFQRKYHRPPRILNLFAYSGLASLHAARAGAEVTHVDASKKAIAHAFENRNVCKLHDAPIRFITDDACGFVAREIRRQREYDGVILDPPKYGRGPKGEPWRLEENLTPLLAQVLGLLSTNAMFIVLTVYAIRASSLAAHNILVDIFSERSGYIESGELAIQESFRPDTHIRRCVPQANFARWLAN